MCKPKAWTTTYSMCSCLQSNKLLIRFTERLHIYNRLDVLVARAQIVAGWNSHSQRCTSKNPPSAAKWAALNFFLSSALGSAPFLRIAPTSSRAPTLAASIRAVRPVVWK